MTSSAHKFPYLPEGRTIGYVSMDNQIMQDAKSYARNHSLDKTMPNASIIVKNGKVISRAANGSAYHETHSCERVRLGIPTGQGYELCEGCHPKNHSEAKAVAQALRDGRDVTGADLYLWGHWWFCEPCWQVMIAAGIENVYVMENSQVLFNREAEGNIIGKQFAEVIA